MVYRVLLDFSLHFNLPDDIGVLNIQDTISAIKKTLNKDLEGISPWLNNNKIALNEAKTKLISFNTNYKNYDADL